MRDALFRKAEARDIDAIARIYADIHTEIEAGRCPVLWVRGVYPTEAVAAEGIGKGDMFVEELDGKIVSAARINREALPSYKDAPWHFDAPENDILILHTLVVSPSLFRSGCAKRFVRFYEKCASDNGIGHLRLDTTETNVPARRLYASLGFTEVGTSKCVFNGIPDVSLVFIEKKIKPC